MNLVVDPYVYLIGPKTDKEIEDVISAGVSKKTRDDTKTCVKIWNQWTSYRQRTSVPSKY